MDTGGVQGAAMALPPQHPHLASEGGQWVMGPGSLRWGPQGQVGGHPDPELLQERNQRALAGSLGWLVSSIPGQGTYKSHPMNA